MSEQSAPTKKPYELPEELIGAYSTWKQKGDPTKDSNRHTYLINPETGKKEVISRAEFKRRYEQELPEEQEEQPGTTVYWSGNNATEIDPTRIPWTPTEVPVATEAEQSEEKKRSGGGLRGKIARVALAAAVVFGGTTMKVGSEYHANSDDTGEVPTEMIIGDESDFLSNNGDPTVDRSATPIFEPTMEASTQPELGVTPVSMPAIQETAEPAPVATPAPTESPKSMSSTASQESQEETPEEQPIVESTITSTDAIIEPTAESPATSPAVETADDDVSGGEEDDQLPMIEPQSPAPDSGSDSTEAKNDTPAELSDALAALRTDASGDSGEAAATDETDQDTTETPADSVESLMVSVTVEPGDGITQVLEKVLARSGHPNMAPEQLFEIYDELVNNPNIGSDAILEGVTVAYNQPTGEYWIQGEGGTEAHLTQAAAEWISGTYLNR